MRKAAALITVCIVIVFLSMMGIAFVIRTIQEKNLTSRHIDSVRVFWLAEAGISRALDELRSDYKQCGTNLWSGSLSSVDGGYSIDSACNGTERVVTSRGFIPLTGSSRAQRVIEVSIEKDIPLHFYTNALYSAGDIDINGDSATVNGDVRYAGECDNPDPITGNATQDSSVAPLALLDFQQLLTISQSQNNYYDEERIDSGDSYPVSFWYSPPTDPNDPTTGIPNIVYITEDLELRGNFGIVGGFFAVVGDVITSPDDVQDATISGNGQIEGMVYTRGSFRINGGGNNLNVDGAVWGGEEIRLNGNVHIIYNSDYMGAVQSLGIDAEAQVTSWEEK